MQIGWNKFPSSDPHSDELSLDCRIIATTRE